MVTNSIKYMREWRAKHPNYNKDYAKSHNNTQEFEKTCACGKKFLGFKNSRYCFECSPYKSRNAEKRKIVCEWCKTQFESNLRHVRFCEICREEKIIYLVKTISERIEKCYQYNERQCQTELNRLEKLGRKFRFKKPHESLNKYYFNEVT